MYKVLALYIQHRYAKICQLFIFYVFSFFSHKVDLLLDERQVVMMIRLLHGMYVYVI